MVVSQYMRTPLQMQNPKSGTKNEAKKKSFSSLLKRGGFVYVNLIGIWELSYAAPSSLGGFAVTNGKTCGSIIVVVRKSNQCEIEPQGNFIALWLFEAW